MARLSVLDQSPVRSGATPADAIRETLALARRCDELGYTRYWLAEHHSPPALAGPGMPEFFPKQVEDLVAFVHGELPPEHPFATVRAMPTGPTAPELWLLGSSDQSAALAAHFGAAFSFAHFINAAGGAEITRAYAREFKPSLWLATPQASAAVFVVCAESHD